MSHLHIVGSGAIGSLLAAGAQQRSVTYSRYPRNVTTVPSYVRWIDDKQVPLEPPKTDLTPLHSDDILIFPLKVHQLEVALNTWKPFLINKPVIVLMHNGMGGQEIAESLLGSDYPLMLATTSHGALKCIDQQNNTYVCYTGKGTIKIGVTSESMEISSSLTTPVIDKVVTLLNTILPNVELADDIIKALWNKLSVNAVINPLTALNDIQNKRVVDDQFSYLRQAICEEFVEVAAAYGVSFNVEQVHANVLAIANATGENYSSMHQDVVHQRVTEINAINGYLVTQAKKKGIHVPVNTLLTEKINALSDNYSSSP